MEETVAKFLTFIGAPVAESYCERLIRTHSDYPSLVSISDTFERLGLEYTIGVVERNELHTLQLPYLLHTEAEGGDIIAIKKQRDLAINEKVLKHWSGILIQIDPLPFNDTKERIDTFKRARFVRAIMLPLVVFGLALLIYESYLFSKEFQSLLLKTEVFALFLTSLFGISIGYLLIAKDLGIKYNSVENFCKVEGNPKTDCNKILNSNGATILGLINLSELVFVCFLSQALIIITVIFNYSFYSSAQLLFSILAILYAPVILYSIYYQYAVAKVWCKLCLLVNANLAVQALFLINTRYVDFRKVIHSQIPNIFIFLFIFLLVLFVVILIKDQIKENIRLVESESEALRVKHSMFVFTNLLKFSKKISTDFAEDEIIIGNTGAHLKLLLVINLYCLPCKEHFQKIVDAVTINSQDLQISLRFVLSGRDINLSPNTVQYIIHYWRENIMGKPNYSQETIKLLQEWFDEMNLETFKVRRPLTSAVIDNRTQHVSAMHHQWIQSEHIRRTPSLFINGYALPQNYNLSDILDMSQEMIHAFEKDKNFLRQ